MNCINMAIQVIYIYGFVIALLAIILGFHLVGEESNDELAFFYEDKENV